MSWVWSIAAKRYRDTDTGQFLSRESALDFVSQSIAQSQLVVDQLSSLVAGGQLDPNDWRDLMRQEIKTEYIREYLLGIGGREQMTFADWGSIGGMLKEQYAYLENFMDEIISLNLSEGQITARARMYTESAREGFERAKVRAAGIDIDLPAYPGDGSSICLTNDQCSWRIEEITDENGNIDRFEAYWELNPAAEHCDTCLERAEQWNPLIIEP